MPETEGLTKKQLLKITGAPPYTITYLKDCGRLPVLRESTGKGISTVYHPDAVKVIMKHMRKSNRRLDDV